MIHSMHDCFEESTDSTEILVNIFMRTSNNQISESSLRKILLSIRNVKTAGNQGFKPEWKLMHLVWIEKIWDGSFRRFANIVITLGKNFLALHLRTLLRTFVSEHPFETDNPLKLNPFVQKWKHSHVRLSSKQGRRTLTVQQQQSATLFTNCTNCCSKIERPAQIEDFLVRFFLFWM